MQVTPRRSGAGMQLAFAFLAHAAELGQGDRLLSVLGGDLDMLMADTFPYVRPALALALKVVLDEAEWRSDHRLTVELRDPDGETMQRTVEFTIEAREVPGDAMRPVGASVVVNYQRVEFPKPGIYSFHIKSDGEALTSVPLRILPAE